MNYLERREDDRKRADMTTPPTATPAIFIPLDERRKMVAKYAAELDVKIVFVNEPTIRPTFAVEESDDE